MSPTIEKLLILQERDKQILRTKTELERVEPERASLNAKMVSTQSIMDAAKLKVKQLESERKKLELDVEAKKSQIEKYANQQLQTKKNDEYRALANEIENCKKVISGLDDQQIEIMEKMEGAQKEVIAATATANEAKKGVESQISNLATREQNLARDLQTLEAGRADLFGAVEESARSRYERLLKNKGATAVVGVNHGVCGGCHMKLPTQTLISCQAQGEIVTCINCGRILYHTPDMDLAFAD